MVFLLLSIICSVLIGFIFKWFDRLGISVFQAIMFNYFTCVACGWIHSGRLPYSEQDMAEPWMFYALLLGFVFIAGFNAAGLTVRYFGVTVSQIMQKMSILLTVPFAILAYGESSGFFKVAGILLALGSIVLVNWPAAGRRNKKDGGIDFWWMPLITWVLAGIIEMVFVLVQQGKMIRSGDPMFITTVFCTAGLLGLVVATAGWVTGRLAFSRHTVFAGVVLGIPNYGSMLFMLMALNSGLEASFVFPLTNVGIILATTIGAVLLFHERLSTVNWWGIVLAVAAILLISM
ncbi:MAG: DMT family transporter [Saprospirales bacterium]|nr:DMT family transporter [Saprospirales bacterium]